LSRQACRWSSPDDPHRNADLTDRARPLHNLHGVEDRFINQDFERGDSFKISNADDLNFPTS
jgi:hypothetical protein